ncbi:MAG: hypothetical protein JSS68_15160 [Actinobacteria bacterium]|nr:hypothetical protein [Actinomycetota bacterium]
MEASKEARFAELKERVANGVAPTVTDMPEWAANYEGDPVENLAGHEWEIAEDYDLAESIFMGSNEAFGAGMALGTEIALRDAKRKRARIEYVMRMLEDDPEKHVETIKAICLIMYSEMTGQQYDGDDGEEEPKVLAEAFPEIAALPRWEQD